MSPTQTQLAAERDRVLAALPRPHATACFVEMSSELTRIRLAADVAGKAEALRRCAAAITVHDFTCGMFRKTDHHLQLHIRGLLRHRGAVVVTALFSVTAEAAQVTRITRDIEKQDLDGLLAALIELENTR